MLETKTSNSSDKPTTQFPGKRPISNKIGNSISNESFKDNLSSSSTETSATELTNSQKNPSINLSENEIKNAYFVPKNYKPKKIIKEFKPRKYFKSQRIDPKDNNMEILEVLIKINKNKELHLKIGKKDNVVVAVKNFCNENGLDKISSYYLLTNVFKGLNSIYAIYNLNLNKDEIDFLKELNEKYFSE